MLDWLFGKKKQQPQQQKPKKSIKQTEAEDVLFDQTKLWMYDFMKQFLSSPIWRVSILDFVDNKCIVFDNEEQNKFQYTIIHNEFKELVGNLVDGMMEEIGMSQQKLAEIIEKGLQSKEKKLFNQLLLADDFLRFKDLMLKRNKSLEQEAIKALQESQIRPTQKEQKVHKNRAEEQLLRQSKRIEEERQHKLQEQEEQMIRKAIELSKIQSKQTQAIRHLEEKATDKVKEELKLQQKNASQEKEQTSKVSSTKPKTSRLEPLKGTQSVKNQLSDLPPLKATLHRNPISSEDEFGQKINQKVEQPKQQVKPQTEQVKQKQAPQSVQNTEEKSQAESMQDRKQRLMAQREKIRKQKEEQRRKQLEQQEQQSKQKLPQPHVQTVVLQEDGFYESNQGKKESLPAAQVNTVSEDELKRRRQLMNKIKNRIIDDL